MTVGNYCALRVGAALLLAGAAWAAESELRLATFQADVTPPLGAVLCHGNVAPASEIVDPLTARGVVLFAEDRPIVLCAVDWVGIGNEAHDAWRKALADAAGTTPDRVTVHVVHQHDTPGVDYTTERLLAAHGLSGAMFNVEAAATALDRAVAVVAEAVRQPRRVTHVGLGKARVEQVASNRRMIGADGKCFANRMSSCRDAALREAPEGAIDPYIRVVSFWDEDRPLACLSYYATHPQSHYGKGGVSWDFVGMARAAREAALPGALHVHFNGAGGDVAAGKYNDGSPENRPVLAGRLEEGMRQAWQATEKTPIRAGDVRWSVLRTPLPVSESIDPEATAETLADAGAETRARVRAARALAWVERMASGHQLELTALEIGPATILHMPGELCIGYQLAAQAMRPDLFLCMAAYAEYGPGYICLREGYAQGGYEPSWSRVSPDVEDVLFGAMRTLLRE